MDTQTQNTNPAPEAPVQANPAPKPGTTFSTPAPQKSFGGFGSGDNTRGGGQRDQKRPHRKMGSREPRVKPEFDQKLLEIRRVTRVASGGRRFSFSVALVAGNRKGSVGVGTGKALDTSIAIDKAFKNARKNMVKLALKNDSIPYNVEAKYCSARVEIRPAPSRGLIAGSAVRNVLELAGIKDVSAKIRSGSKNKLNIARAAVEALSAFKVK